MRLTVQQLSEAFDASNLPRPDAASAQRILKCAEDCGLHDIDDITLKIETLSYNNQWQDGDMFTEAAFEKIKQRFRAAFEEKQATKVPLSQQLLQMKQQQRQQETTKASSVTQAPSTPSSRRSTNSRVMRTPLQRKSPSTRRFAARTNAGTSVLSNVGANLGSFDLSKHATLEPTDLDRQLSSVSVLPPPPTRLERIQKIDALHGRNTALTDDVEVLREDQELLDPALTGAGSSHAFTQCNGHRNILSDESDVRNDDENSGNLWMWQLVGVRAAAASQRVRLLKRHLAPKVSKTARCDFAFDEDDVEAEAEEAGTKEEASANVPQEESSQKHEESVDARRVFSPLQRRYDSLVAVCGRVAVEGDDDLAPLNSHSVLLAADTEERARTDRAGNEAQAFVKIDMSGVKSNVRLFPGQTIAVEGVSPHSRQTFRAKRILTDASLPRFAFSVQHADTLNQINQQQQNAKRPTTIMTAAGPFFFKDAVDGGIVYAESPFEALAQEAGRRRPDVLILSGPFLTMAMAERANGDPDRLLESMLEAFLTTVRKAQVGESADTLAQTHVVLLPAQSDVAHSVPVFPQPAFAPSLGQALRTCRVPVTLAANPCQLLLGSGVTVCASSLDALSLMRRHTLLHQSTSSASASSDQSTDQMDRQQLLCECMLEQQSVLPLQESFAPSSRHAGVSFAAARAHLCDLSHTPDLLLTPSLAEAFAKRTRYDCVAVNPSFLVKSGVASARYAWITVHPASDAAKTLPDGRVVTPSVAARTRVDLVRI
ncbi:MAG: hypothetical protein MHM6MM_004721 [Cercozoa sp. M6MM]